MKTDPENILSDKPVSEYTETRAITALPVTGTHTPGPWHIHEKPVMWSIRSQNDWYIAENIRPLPTPGERDANARLIAAAPDLHEALTGLLTCGRKDLSNPKYDSYFDTAAAALAKAEGR